MEDLDRDEYVKNVNKAETEEERKNITAGSYHRKIAHFHKFRSFVLEFEAQEMKLRRRSLGNIHHLQ